MHQKACLDRFKTGRKLHTRTLDLLPCCCLPLLRLRFIFSQHLLQAVCIFF